MFGPYLLKRKTRRLLQQNFQKFQKLQNDHQPKQKAIHEVIGVILFFKAFLKLKL